MNLFDTILKPTLLLDENAARANIRRMATKARAAGIVFRPHFKTHQSLEIANWFRDEGVEKITVSSLDMAEFFAGDGWTDITLAFTANLRQLEGIDQLAGRIRLGLLVESSETVDALGQGLRANPDIWIKVDAGAGRTGLAWDDPEAVVQVARLVGRYPRLQLRGLLTHAGNTYNAPDPPAAAEVFAAANARMSRLRAHLEGQGLGPLLVSVGDTPGCSASTDFGGVDEIRPGNFVFFDALQYQIGACAVEDIAVALACPVVALHPQKGEAVIYGGAIHLSKDTLVWQGERVYGLVCRAENGRWSSPLDGGVVGRISQEHGILRLGAQDLARLRVGDLVCILPAHSCLTAQAMGRYLSLDGCWIEMMHAGS